MTGGSKRAAPGVTSGWELRGQPWAAEGDTGPYLGQLTWGRGDPRKGTLLCPQTLPPCVGGLAWVPLPHLSEMLKWGHGLSVVTRLAGFRRAGGSRSGQRQVPPILGQAAAEHLGGCGLDHEARLPPLGTAPPHQSLSTLGPCLGFERRVTPLSLRLEFLLPLLPGLTPTPPQRSPLRPSLCSRH